MAPEVWEEAPAPMNEIERDRLLVALQVGQATLIANFDAIRRRMDDFVTRAEHQANLERLVALEVLTRDRAAAVEARMSERIKEVDTRLDKLDRIVDWILRCAIGAVVSGAIGLMFLRR